MKRGFTLIELIVSMAIFTVVLFLLIDALFVIVTSNRKAQADKKIMDSISLAIEEMTRNLRSGSDFYCDKTENPLGGKDCNSATGANAITFLSNEGTVVSYSLENGTITKNGTPITASDVKIDYLGLAVKGSGTNDGIQARVLIVVRGSAAQSATQRTEFNIQTTAVQRSGDK
jgi:prepilin-type N-terminal cleavage/methylation domain-containing protein